ncbi:nitrite reductase [Candidatus Saganbacteria bacterium CG08_land_8_20_14_0_20_45_16]|uniref:Nitrite reductase n=1 Tax=Candidatus Saganbacteria bacterium CG08_land_8_20_14_0_20_45_16 TaxID=2014293 RepID=A0A2H0XWF2_UNCSA|nr:MAG: nitrite reductase [Candidatus Saganbacteria bacterium CG08_land_8_20_14_0_20_45_16]
MKQFYDLPKSLDSEIKEYENLVNDYLAGTIPAVKLKAFRVPFGVYEQRENETYMCRVRLPCGAITPEQLIGVARIAEKYSDRPLHFTTRQEVQVHHVKLKDTVAIIKELKALGLATRGGGGNTVRNIIGDGSSLIEPFVRALTTRLIAEKDSWNLPRKLKIAFSGDSSDKGLATVNDLGFIYKKQSGQIGFTVYIAGGLGANPRLAKKLYDFAPANEVYNISRAVKQLFDKYGNRKNKHVARLRFLFESLGAKEFTKRLDSELKEVRQQQYPVLEIKADQAKTEELTEYYLFLGDIEPREVIKLAEKLKPYGDDVLRANFNQNLVIRNVPAKALSARKVSRFFGQAVACTGAATCRLGICLSRELLKAIKEEVKDSDLDLNLKISGCPNSCGQHHLADIGFYGVIKRFNDRLVPCYQLMMGGVVGEGKSRLAEKFGVLPAKAIPNFLVELLAIYPAKREAVISLVDKYSQVPEFTQAPGFYYDWGSTQLFSLADKTEGECSAGMYDLINWDFTNIEQAIANNEPDQVVLSASRALLVTKGLEPKSAAEAVVLFKQHFIGQHLDSSFASTVDKYLNREKITLQEAKELASAVKKLYDSMDNSLKFPEIEKEVKQGSPDTKTVGSQASREFRDFRGIVCPMNFVKTKLVLETMNVNDQLEILLDDGEPINNVPASVRAEGHEIIKREKIDNYWRVVMEKH